MPYHIAGIDVHKKMLAVVVANVEGEGDYRFERHKVGTSPGELRALAGWLVEREVEEVVMESTAQYWRPVWEALELHWRPKRRTREGASPISGTLHLAQAQSNRGAGGRKKDFPDAERLVKRLVAQELILSFVPDAEQRLWRTVMRRKYQITRSFTPRRSLTSSVIASRRLSVLGASGTSRRSVHSGSVARPPPAGTRERVSMSARRHDRTSPRRRRPSDLGRSASSHHARRSGRRGPPAHVWPATEA